MKTIDIVKVNLLVANDRKIKVKDFGALFFCLIIVTFLVLLYRGSQLQVISSAEYYDSSITISTAKEYVSSQRGLFLDRELDILAKNTPSYALYLYNKEYLPDDFELIEKVLLDNGISYLDLKSSIINSKYDIKVTENLESSRIEKLKSSSEFNKYFYLINTQKREYLYPEEFSHVIGYTGKTVAEDLKSNYSQFDQIGKYKLELKYENDLKGTKGLRYSFDGIENYIPAEAGSNIQLTIDKDWQVALYKIIKKYSEEYNSAGGAGVIIDNSTGEVLAIVSYPGFDTNLYINGISAEKHEDYLNNRKLPLIDKSLSLQIAPGSTFKIITAYTLLENNIVDESTTYFSNRCLENANFDFCEYQKYFYGQMNIVRALYKSSNLFFCVNSLKLEQQGNLAKLFESEKLFGLGQLTGIDLPGELPGNIDTPEYKKEVFNLGWYSGDTCNAVIGQGSNTVTPIQVALVAQAISNKGRVYQPRVVSRLTDIYGNTIRTFNSNILRDIPISDSTYNLINEGMYNVANNWDGSVYYFLNGLPGNLRVKTGTAEASEILFDGSINNTTHGWIMGNFDFNGKTYSFANVLNLGGGGFYVGQITRDFINCLYSDFPAECK